MGQLVLFGLAADLPRREPEPPPRPDRGAKEHAEAKPESPALPDLDALFSELNARFFAGALAATVEWSNRLRAASGKCNITRRIIRISVRHHLKRPDLLEATLAHEMLHLVVPDHGREFRQIGVHISRTLGVTWEQFRYAENWADMSRFKYVYACPSCHAELASRKRRTASCGRCGGGKFDERFRLTLTESRARPGSVLLGERPVRNR